jgi:hypothetical protein
MDDDFVRNSDIEGWIKEKSLGVSMKKYGTDLKSYCNMRKLENVTNDQKKRN